MPALKSLYSRTGTSTESNAHIDTYKHYSMYLLIISWVAKMASAQDTPFLYADWSNPAWFKSVQNQCLQKFRNHRIYCDASVTVDVPRVFPTSLVHRDCNSLRMESAPTQLLSYLCQPQNSGGTPKAEVFSCEVVRPRSLLQFHFLLLTSFTVNGT